MYPDEPTLIARGKYSTLGSDRRVQLERVQKICTSITTASYASLRDCELTPPTNAEHIQEIEKCLKNLIDARTKLVDLGKQMVELKPTAWPT